MPAEWAPHDATWLSWPRSDCVSFRGELDGVLLTFAEMARVISQFEPVRISVTDIQMEANVRAFLSGRNVPLANIGFHHVPTNEPWCRDHGPTLVARDNEVAVVDWTYNAYGGKFRPFDSDDAVPRVIAGQLGLRLFQPGIVLEGDLAAADRNWGPAIDAYRRAFTQQKTLPVGTQLGRALRAADRGAEADTVLRDWVRAEPTNLPLRLLAGETEVTQQRWRQAYDHYAVVIEA
jgi:hypothetical protein